MPPAKPAHIAVMLSGGGRTLLNLVSATKAGKLNAVIELVIASRECPGAHARDAGLRTVVIPGVIPRETLASLLARHGIDWVVLAGYLKLVHIPPEYRGRIVNIHPALLPKFGGPGMYGERVHKAVLESGDPLSGCTVHLCDEVFDRGPILHRKTCPVLPGDTPETLAKRVFAAECEAYPVALQRLFTEGSRGRTQSHQREPEEHRGTKRRSTRL
jgi:folate-dependent phosphoribosylglycinamide formyltransferase PurN